MSSSIWRKKPLEAYQTDIQKSQLNRVLGRGSLTAMGIGALIGGGIFVFTGTAAHFHAGPALSLSFIVTGIVCIFAALCYAELASILPVEGSAYAYAYGTIGELFAWVVAWGLVLEYAMGAMTVAVSWSGYFIKLLSLGGINMPFWLTNDIFSATAIARDLGVPAPAFAINLPAMMIIWLVTLVVARGVAGAAKANNAIVIVKVGVILFIVIFGLFYVNTANWNDFIPARAEIVGERGQSRMAYGWQGIFSGASAIFFAYVGFDAVSTQAGEAVNPRRDVPFAIIASLLICTFLYVSVSMVMTGMLNYKDITGEALRAPVAYAFEAVNQSWAVLLITFTATLGLISVMIVMLLGQTRIFLGMAKDGLLPPFFGSIHPKFKTPWKSTMLVGLIVSLTASSLPITLLGEMTSFGTMFAFTLICGAVWILRVKRPDLPRPFKVNMLPVISSLGILCNLFLMSQLDELAITLAAIWMVAGLAVYFAYGRRHSKYQ